MKRILAGLMALAAVLGLAGAPAQAATAHALPVTGYLMSQGHQVETVSVANVPMSKRGIESCASGKLCFWNCYGWQDGGSCVVWVYTGSTIVNNGGWNITTGSLMDNGSFSGWNHSPYNLRLFDYHNCNQSFRKVNLDASQWWDAQGSDWGGVWSSMAQPSDTGGCVHGQ